VSKVHRIEDNKFILKLSSKMDPSQTKRINFRTTTFIIHTMPLSTEKLMPFVIYYARMWQNSLHMERTFGKDLRMPFSFPDIDRFGEGLFGLMSGMKGSGTKGSGADLTDGRIQDEVKTVNLCQPSRCKTCSKQNSQKRSPWSDTVCAHCGSSDLNKIGDSRFGISASAHVKDEGTIRRYCLVAIEHEEGDLFSITCWTISSDDPYFLAYITEQNKHTSKTCNLLPRSFDFKMSGAKQVLKFNMTLPNDVMTEPTIGAFDTTEVVEDMLGCELYSAEREKLGIQENESVSIERAKRELTARKKSHGKPRGSTSRHVGGDDQDNSDN